MVVPRLLHLLLVLWCAVSVVLAYNLDKRLAPKGKLGVRLDFNLATTWPDKYDSSLTPQVPRNWFYSSHLTFTKPVSEITDGQMWKIAKDAFNELNTEKGQYGIGIKPNAMALLAFGNELILASSQKGDAFNYQYGATPVLKALQMCQCVWKDVTGEDDEHKNEGKCGEPMAAQLYYTQYKDKPLSERKARIATIVKGKQTAPCGDPDRDVWGCNLFVAREGLEAVGIAVAAENYDLKTLAGGNPVISQIQLCTAGSSSSDSSS